ncbi:MAG TPA: hypothetical protein VMM78_00575 [Thermomicrobiales bacterium]|nr:hypothetical protein [Thermomicrobiales bacterium]
MTAQTSQPTAPKRRLPQRSRLASPDPDILDEPASPAAPDEDATPVETVALVSGQGQQGAGFSFKVLATGALFRCQVMRNPNQPRFWCITIYLCLDGGSPDKEHPRWLSNDLFTREEMPGALAAVQTNLAGWLEDSSRADLRTWVMTQKSRSPMASSPRFAGVAASS